MRILLSAFVFLFIPLGYLKAQKLNYPLHPEYKVLSVYQIGDSPENIAILHIESERVTRSEVGKSRNGIDFIGVKRSVEEGGVILMEGVVVKMDGGLFSIGFKDPSAGLPGIGVLNLDRRKNHIVIGDYEYVYGAVEWDADERKYIFTDGVLITGEKNYQLYADKIVIYYDKEMNEVTKSTFDKLVTLVTGSEE